MRTRHTFFISRARTPSASCAVSVVYVCIGNPTLACWRHGTMARPLALWKPARHRLVRLRRASVLVSVSFLRSSHPPPLTVDPFTCIRHYAAPCLPPEVEVEVEIDGPRRCSMQQCDTHGYIVRRRGSTGAFHLSL